jgi:hypothetical protein
MNIPSRDDLHRKALRLNAEYHRLLRLVKAGDLDRESDAVKVAASAAQRASDEFYARPAPEPA